MINSLIKECKKNNIELEVSKIQNKEFYVETFNNKVIRNNVSDTITYSLKALINNKNIYLTTSDINNKSKIIKKIKENSKLCDNANLSEFANNIKLAKKDIHHIDVDIKKVSEFLLNLNKLKKDYKELKTISGIFESINKNISIINEKTNLEDKNEYINGYIEIIVKNNKNTETNVLSIYTNEFNEANVLKEVKEKIEEAIKRLDSTSTKTINTSVLINNECSFHILNSFKSMFYAKQIRLKASVLTDKLNKNVFSNKLTIVEDPSNTSMINSRLFDSEGTKTYYKEIVKNGVFKTILYNNEEAGLNKCLSTGNSYGVRNMFIEAGTKTYQELIMLMKNGIIITSVVGLHSGINTVTGDFSVQCEGYEVKNGKIDKPIKMFVMSSNILTLFNNIIEVGSDLKIFNTTGGSPSLLINNIDIAGSEK